MRKLKNTQAGVSLLEVTLASSLFMFMMGITLSLTFNIQDLAKAETDRSHLQSQLQEVVDEIVNDIRESKWRWTYVSNAVNGNPSPNSYFLYPTGRDQNKIFHFHDSGEDIGLTDWQGMTLLAAIPNDNANINNSGEIRYDLWKFTHFDASLVPIVKDGSGVSAEEKDDEVTPLQHGDVTIEEDDTQIFVRDNDGALVYVFNKNGTPGANQTAELLMTNVTRFFINATVDGAGQLVLPDDNDNVAKYRFPFGLDMEAFYVSTNVRVSLSTAVLAENKNNL